MREAEKMSERDGLRRDRGKERDRYIERGEIERECV